MDISRLGDLRVDGIVILIGLRDNDRFLYQEGIGKKNTHGDWRVMYGDGFCSLESALRPIFDFSIKHRSGAHRVMGLQYHSKTSAGEPSLISVQLILVPLSSRTPSITNHFPSH